MSNRITFENVRLAFDPELRWTQGGKAVCQVKFADQQRKLNKQTKEWENASDALWVTASVWDADGEALAEAVHKGDKVTVTGTLVARNYEAKDGNTRTSLELDFAKVAVVPRASQAQRGASGGGWSQQGQQQTRSAQAQGDPWATHEGHTS